MFFKRNAPIIADYDKTKSDLLKLDWLTEVYNVESNKSIYDITDLGYQYYFAICMSINYTQLFDGPKLAEGQTSAYINGDIDLTEEGYLVDGIDCKRLTPKAAEYLYVLIDSHGKEIPVKKSGKTVKNGSTNKVGKYTAMFMRGMQKFSEVAQEYDKNSTTATRNAWGKNKKSSSRKKTLTRKRTYRRSRRKKRKERFF